MVLGAALLGLALSAPVKVPAKAVAPPPPVACPRYRVLAEKNELLPEAEVAAWGTSALAKAALLEPASPCFLHVRITAGPLRTAGKEDGYVAHVSASTRRLLREGKLVTHERGMLLVEAHREDLLPRVHAFLDDFVAGLVTAAAPATPGGARTVSDGG